MRLLLDTHVVLWELEGSRRVSQAAQEAIEQATELLYEGREPPIGGGHVESVTIDLAA